jgi:hypothetical protein
LGHLKEFEKKIDLSEKCDEITRFDGNAELKRCEKAPVESANITFPSGPITCPKENLNEIETNKKF